ncbi:M28 family peptidase [Candidatus Palauibacter sp.]|uniref:M28 family peptidase n=1 Tax=Candidatus Palauibacter sp. TaxID=3101350 RepID=UPI003B5A22BB
MKPSVRVGLACSLAFVATQAAVAQSFPSDDPVIRAIWEEGVERSQVYALGQVMMDSIGPRLTGSSAMAGANDWAVARYAEWGIEAYKERYGTWRGWERGISHIDLVSPRVRSLEGMAAAWSPATDGPVEADVVVLADAGGPEAFEAWLPEVRGKFVLISRPESSCRPEDNLEWFARPETLARMTEERERAAREWREREENTGLDRRLLPEALDAAGAAGIIRSQWSEGWGVNKIFGTGAERAPVVDLSCEAYGLVYRLAENGQGPVLRVDARARFLGEVPVFNAIAEIPGTAEPEEYVILGGHYDSWDGSDGALDNGTGAVAIMEAMRILKRAVPNPRRTIIGALWNGEEQGLNGSRAFVEDHPEILARTHTVFNVDHGNGPVTFIPMQGFAGAAGRFGDWLGKIPSELADLVTLEIPGMPESGGTDHASFLCAGVPAFSFHVGAGRGDDSPMDINRWDTSIYTWHTNRDSFDKIIFEDLRDDAVMTALLVYLASEDPDRMPRDQRAMPGGSQWPDCRPPARSYGQSNR